MIFLPYEMCGAERLSDSRKQKKSQGEHIETQKAVVLGKDNRIASTHRAKHHLKFQPSVSNLD